MRLNRNPAILDETVAPTVVGSPVKDVLEELYLKAAWKSVHVFISSTFLDMQSERDWLVRFVFPRLRERLLRHRIHLIEVDLRWGVTSEQNTTSVCREVIDKCRPRFLCILGGRYGYVPEGLSRSITADEISYAVLDRPPEERQFCYFYLRADESTAAMIERHPGEFREPVDSENRHALAALKNAVTNANVTVRTYHGRWDNRRRRLTDLNDFGDRVHDDLLNGLKDDPELQDRFKGASVVASDEFADVDADMSAFVEARCTDYVLGSRRWIMRDLKNYILGANRSGYFCLTGAIGCGKSALLAQFCRDMEQGGYDSTLLIRHFVGASPGSTDSARTLRRLCHELKPACPDVLGEIPYSPNDLHRTFLDLLKKASKQYRILIVLDGIERLDENQRSTGVYWLPESLPDNVRIILSAAESPSLTELRQRLRRSHEVEVPLLISADCLAIIERFTIRYQKRFESEQLELLMKKTDIANPLYLSAALAELRTLGTYEAIADRIEELPPTIPELFAWILERLKEDDGFRASDGTVVGPELVTGFAGLIQASRHGLSQRELIDLLDPNDPRGNVAALLFLLRDYLVHRGELLDFYHEQFKQAAAQMLAKSHAPEQLAHSELARYFQNQADPDGDGSWSGPSARALHELPFHLGQATQWEGVYDVLTSPAFIEARLLGARNSAPSESDQRRATHYALQELITDLEMIAVQMPEDARAATI